MRTEIETRYERLKALVVVNTRHLDAGRGGEAREGAEPNDVTQLSAGGGQV
ncbi:predicted protein [Ostreococcus lucimarinus CCE9901]|jgi:hypothetical protein|uniref:Uncharacterized protein n=1 Tax=Ostreococcus lucimarinus (strain CCE9901) TaxID=436017 RepID=A4S596_OSTLU|nr:predicted protein [Ostreococcus lucimarinus CCE9901]ABO98861.1 predicted protein [Ostreococcus lucimarinus CCE9901]|eukprot:XP_001420568.1 predicted protein [Ostreococcus lucimarinus CCE9901]